MLPAVRGVLSQLAWSAAFGGARRTLSVVVRKAISSAAELSEVDCEHLALHLPATVNEAARRILRVQEIGGSALLRMDASRLERYGMTGGGAAAVMAFVDPMRTGGPKTVHIFTAGGGLGSAVESSTATYAFESQEELKEFLDSVGASGLCRSGSATSEVKRSLKKLVDGGTYTLVYMGRGSIVSRVEGVEASSASSAKIILANAKKAVEQQSLRVFGVQLTAVGDDILVKDGPRMLGDVDSLFTGEGLHVLLERKQRHDDSSPDAVIAQMKATRDAYRLKCMHVVDSSAGKESKIAVVVKSMLFAEAIDDAAIQCLLKGGINVLTLENMRIYTQPSA